MEFAFVQNHKNKGRIIPPSLIGYALCLANVYAMHFMGVFAANQV